jgi:hypothetical protein
MLELVLMVPSGMVANVDPLVRVIVYDMLIAPNLIGIYYLLIYTYLSCSQVNKYGKNR